jgi:alkanesulfonate monooxygenase SsuD/methylene tetrahydromethanopterin reductase-like flavin-dependent oxidoreductase (luciferase family)
MVLKFGVADHVDHDGGAMHAQYETRMRLVEAYDRVGMHGYHVAEHHGTPLGLAPSPSVYLAAVAQRTKRLRFGPLVYLLPLYHPIRLIEEVCLLDQMSGGRFMLGIGRGVSPVEFGFYGADLAEAPAIYAEVLECLMRGFRNETLTFEGEYFRFKDVPMVLRPFQKPHPDLWYGVLNPDSVVWAAANDVNIVTPAPAGHMRRITDRYRAEWQAHGKPAEHLPLMGLGRHIVVAETDAEAEAVARRAYARWRYSLTKLWVERHLPITGLGAVYPESYDDVVKVGSLCAGSPATVRAFIADQVARSGANYLVSWMAFGDMGADEALYSVELFGAEVMPAFGTERAVPA